MPEAVTGVRAPVAERDTFVTAILHLRIVENLGDGIEIWGPLRLTNEPSVARRIVTPAVEGVIGRLEAHAIRSAPALVYGELEGSMTGEMQQARLSELMYATSAFLVGLWLARDHGAHFEIAYLGRQGAFSSNMVPTQQATAASGGFEGHTEFSRAELEGTLPMFRRWEKGLAATQLTRDANRLERTIYMLQAARAAADLALKITQYCVCFETLVGTATTELTHRLSERIAVLLESDPARRLKTYDIAREAYGLRSTVLHGGALKQGRVEALAELARDCDDLLRRLLLKLLGDSELQAKFGGDAAVLDAFFLDLLFQTSSADAPLRAIL
jgi:hypothetical protein